MKKIIYILVFVLLHNHVWAITPVQKDYHIRNINKTHGLPQDFVYDIYQDSLGYYWIGTGKGLVYYDGKDMTHFTQADGLQDDMVSSILMDRDGFIWLGHFKGGITRISPKYFTEKKDTNNKYISTLKTEGKLSSPIVSISETSDGRIIFTSRNEGMFLVSKHLELLKMPFGFQMEEVYESIQNSKGSMLVATDEGLFIGSRKGRKFVIDYIWTDLKSQEVYALYQDDNRMIVVSESGLYTTGANGIEELIKMEGVPEDLLDDLSIVKDIEFSPEGHLWLGTQSDGLYIFELKNTNSLHLKAHYDRDNGLGTNRIVKIMKDREGMMWMASYGDGVYEMHGNMFQLKDQEILQTDVKRLLNHKGILYAASQDGLLYQMADGNWDTIIGTEEMVITSLLSHNDKVYLGTEEKGLFILDDNSISQIDIKSGELGKMINYIVANDKEMWVATKGGLFLLKNDTLVRNYTTSHGLLHNNINHLLLDGDKLWVTSEGFGINLWDGEVFNKYIPVSSDGVTIVQAIAKDSKGLIWFGTNGEGIYIFDGIEFKNLSTRNGLASNFVYGLMLDSKGEMWAMHRNALSKISSSSHFVNIYDRLNGFHGKDLNIHATAIDKNDCLWFGTKNGLVCYDPRIASYYTPDARVKLSKLLLFDESVALEEEQDLSYKAYKMTFVLDILSGHMDVAKGFEYKMNGMDYDWMAIPEDGRVNYPRVTDGEYEFLVRNRKTQEVVLYYKSSVAPPLWRNPWVLGVSFFSIALFVWITVRLRIRSLKRAKSRLEGIVQERTKELTEKTEQISLMFESLPVISYVTEVEVSKDTAVFKYNFVSGSFEQRTGYSADMLLDDPSFWEENIHPDDQNHIIPNLFSFYIKGNSEFDFRWKIADGSYRWFRNLSKKVELEPGIINHVGLWLDITESKQAEDELKASEERYRDIIDNSLDVICIHDMEGQIVTINPAFTSIMGYQAAEYQDKNLRDFVDDKYKPQFNAYLREIAKSGTSTGYMQMKAKDGSIKVLEYKNTVKKDDGENAIVRGLARDVTEKISAERQIRQLNIELEKRVQERTQQLAKANDNLKDEVQKHIDTADELKEINHELDTFVYRATHDLKGPLASVEGLISIANDEVKSLKDAHFYFDMISNGVSHLDDILNALLEAITIKEGKLNIVDLELENTVDEVINSLRDRPDAENVTFTKSVEWKGSYAGDKYLLTSIMQNLIENGIKYGRNRLNKTEIICNLSQVKEGLKIEVADNGEGMSEEVKGKIFDMFYRGHESSQGTGLGLYIVKKAVKKLGGEIDVESEDGKGSIFTVFLPDSHLRKKSA